MKKFSASTRQKVFDSSKFSMKVHVIQGNLSLKNKMKIIGKKLLRYENKDKK